MMQCVETRQKKEKEKKRQRWILNRQRRRYDSGGKCKSLNYKNGRLLNVSVFEFNPKQRKPANQPDRKGRGKPALTAAIVSHHICAVQNSRWRLLNNSLNPGQLQYKQQFSATYM